MPHNHDRKVITLLLVFLSVALFVGCGGQGTETAEEAETPVVEVVEAVQTEPEISPEAEAAMVAVLEKADAFDGSADRVVQKCANCALMMDGNPEFTTEVVGFEMHFCSDECKDGFSEGVEEKLVALEIPDPAVQ
jgi:hypothetical protein